MRFTGCISNSALIVVALASVASAEENDVPFGPCMNIVEQVGPAPVRYVANGWGAFHGQGVPLPLWPEFDQAQIPKAAAFGGPSGWDGSGEEMDLPSGNPIKRRFPFLSGNV